jgi:hypothetical protein
MNSSEFSTQENVIIPYGDKKPREPLSIPKYPLTSARRYRKMCTWIALQILHTDADDINQINKLSKAAFVINASRGFLDTEINEKLLKKVEKLEQDRGVR